MNWKDEYGLIHLSPDPSPTDSENSPLFTAHYYSYHSPINETMDYDEEAHEGDLREAIASIDRRSWFAPSGNWVEELRDQVIGGNPYPHMSHDNMTGLYCLYWLRDGKIPSHLPVLKWNDRWWLHVRDLCFYSFAHIAHKGGFLWNALKHLLLIFPSISMMVSCMRQPTETSGKCLTFLRCHTFGLKKTFKLCSMILTNKSWFDVFRYYFKHEDHPIPALVAQLQEIE